MAPLPPFPWIDVAIILALVVLNGLFAMAELAIVSSQARAAGGDGAHRQARREARRSLLAADPGKFLSTTQVGITLIAIIAGAYSGANLGEPTALRLVRLRDGGRIPRGRLGFAIVIGLTTYASVVIGELVPKQFALRNARADRSAIVALPMRWLALAAAPIVWLLDSTSALVLPIDRDEPRIDIATSPPRNFT